MQVNDPLCRIEQVSKSFGKKTLALDAISASIPKGKIVGLVGPDGSGKTTLIRLMASLLIPTKGTIEVGGYDTVKDPDQIHAMIGYMPQKFGLYEDLSVEQNLELYADLRGVKEEREKIFQKLLGFTNLEPFKKRQAGNLSGGMKQKLGLACTLIMKPKLLLLDEPSVGVDPISRRELWQMVAELAQEDIAVVWSTSYLDEAEKCDSVIVLNEGKLIYHGAPNNLTKRVEKRVFKVPYTEGKLTQIIQDENVIDAVIQGSDIRVVYKKEVENFVPPRFEDAFMDIVGGIAMRQSPLTEKMKARPIENKIIIEAQGLTKKFGEFTAADDISLEVPQGEIFGLLGPNGAGKTTTFKMLCGLIKPTQGRSFIEGMDLQTAKGEARAHIGYMAQKFSLYGNLSVRQNLEFFAGIYSLQNAEKRKAINEMVEIFSLGDYLNELADILPLGFKQRLALSCSLMHRPDVLFLDEPTSGVDPITRREFWTHIYGLVDKGMTIMVTTHFMDEAEYCDRIGLVYQSKLITVGKPEELKKKAKSDKNPDPTLEDAFIYLIENYDQK